MSVSRSAVQSLSFSRFWATTAVSLRGGGIKCGGVILSTSRTRRAAWLELHTGVLDDLSPACDVVFEKCREFLRRVADDLRAFAGKLLAHTGQVQRLDDRGV